MDPKQILRHCDHTLLRPTATWPEIRQVCDDALAFGCASACIPPAYIRQAAGHVGNELKLCTVIGFPNGSSTTAVKVFETEDAIRGGADEIDMVINLGWVKEERWDDVLGGSCGRSRPPAGGASSRSSWRPACWTGRRRSGCAG